MRIKSIEYKNFRNFRDQGKISCSTDGKITIIYGKNGDGKTTLHQLFQWIIYGKTKFNKTTTEHLYNLSFENEQEFGKVFEVEGTIDFEHNGEAYSLKRICKYKKGINESEKLGEDFSLQKMDSDYNYKKVDRPQEMIEKLLPSGLCEYFFFDGESMIADLRVKGKDSASKLRKALYSMFDLDVIESAIDHLGRIDLKTTVLGKLYLSKGTIASGSEIAAAKTNIENVQNRIQMLTEELGKCGKEKENLSNRVGKISEQIGETKSKSDYEKQRKDFQKARDVSLNNVRMAQSGFGDSIISMFPDLFISKAVIDAMKKLHLKVSTSNLPSGINKKLIAYLTKETTEECICGNKLCEKDKKHIKEFLSLMPPKSYSSMYHDFTKSAAQTAKGYDKEKIETFIKAYLANQEQAEQYEKKIKELDELQKNSKDIEELIIARQKAEARIKELDEKINDLRITLAKLDILLKKEMKNLDTLTKGNAVAEAISHKIEIMEAVIKHFKAEIEEAANKYSVKLQENIQTLLCNMLTSKRSVTVSNQFSVRVIDSYNDESKSEGQFAVVSFAYIGGILKMLKEEERFKSKEYPLVLDGPFSKLDPDQRLNVVKEIPQFAPQVIIFSKDDLHDVIDKKFIGRVWTIESNDEKNVAVVKEGKLWK